MKNDGTNKSYATLSMRIFESVFFALTVIVCYSIITLNYHVLLFMLFLSLLSVPFRGRSEKYISWIRDEMQTAKFFRRVERIYE